MAFIIFLAIYKLFKSKKNAAKSARLPNQSSTRNGFHFTILKKFLFHVKEVLFCQTKLKMATWFFGKYDLKRTIPVHIVNALYPFIEKTAGNGW